MFYKDKQSQMRDFVVTSIIKGRLQAGQAFFEKKFFTSKFKVNPSYVEDLLVDLEKEGIIGKNAGAYIVTASNQKISWLKEEYLHEYINEFVAKLGTINVDLNEAIKILEQRNMANG